MAKKLKSPLPPPSADTSSDDESDLTPPPKHHQSDSDDDSDDSHSSSQEQHQPQNPNPPIKSPTSSDSESDSSSESDSDTPLPKPLASKPMDQTSKPNPNSAQSTNDKHALKRPAKTTIAPVNNPPKRAKKKGTDGDGDGDGDEEMKDVKASGGGGESNSKKLLQRRWSEDEEIVILKGMAEFTSKSGQDPYTYIDVFYDSIKKSLRIEASRVQLREKIRRMKLKFEKNALRGKNGEDPKFSKQLEREVFELSKKVWGNDTLSNIKKAKSDVKVVKSPKKGVISNSAAAPKSDANKNLKADIAEFSDASAIDSTLYLMEVMRVNSLGEDVVKRGMELIGASKRKEFEVKWKELQAAELELSVKRVALIADHARLILEACKSSNQD